MTEVGAAVDARSPVTVAEPAVGPDPAPAVPRTRLTSLDALRGFDMMWIVGGELVVAAAATATGWPWLQRVEQQFHHATWNGFTFYDLIFPLFLFLAGASMPFSFAGRLAKGGTRRQIYRHVVTRGLVLVGLGFLYNGLLDANLHDTRLPSVLGRIGLASTGAAFIALNTTVRGRVVWIVAILLGYWAAMKLVPVPGHGAGDLALGHNLADYLDQRLIPGKLHDPGHDPEGLLGTLPAVASVLIGNLAGEWLKDPCRPGRRKALGLAAAGAAGVGLAQLWNLAFPINKNLWTSSFVLQCAGLSLLALSGFYLVMDVWQWRRWAFPFVVIGGNSILIYLAYRVFDFQRPAHFLFDGVLKHTGSARPVLWALAVLLVEWLLLYGLHRRRVFLKI